MPVEFKDYYASLGVPRTASEAEIKKAFRKLSLQYHPDRAKNKAAAEEKFKEINEAYEVLGDPDKRKKYDELGAAWNQPGGYRPAPGGPQAWDFRGGEPGEGFEFHFDGTGFSDFFEQFFGRRAGRADDFASAFHRQGRTGFGRQNSVAERGQDIEGDLLVALDEVFQGATRTINLRRTDPRTGQSDRQTLRVKIPAGVHEGQRIRLAGQGQPGRDGGPAGDLYLRVKFAKHPELRVRGADLYHDLELAPWEAVLGGTVPLPTLDGLVSLKIPPGTAAGQQFRLRGKGLPTADGPRGDLYAIATITVPTAADKEEKALWEQLAGKSKFNPRR